MNVTNKIKINRYGTESTYGFTLPYGVTDTASDTAVKVTTCAGFELSAGVILAVQFVNANTATSPQLNVNSTGAKPIYHKGAAIDAGMIKEGAICWFRYNGTQYDLIGSVGDGDGGSGSFRDIAFSIATTDWTLTNGEYVAEVSDVHITSTSGIDVQYDRSAKTALTGDIYAEKGSSKVTFTTDALPAATLTGIIRIFDGIIAPQDVMDSKAEKVTGATAGNFAALDSAGNLTDSGHKHSDYLTSHQDITGKLDKNQGSTNSGKFMKVGSDGLLTPDNVPDPTGKADKVANATNGNFAALDANGNLTDSGHKHSDYLTAHQDISGKLDTSLKGAANGLAELDANGKVPSSQLPSYVDDVLEYANSSAFPATGESGKVYIAQDTNVTYRWSGSTYAIIGSDLALGETASTAYRGDYGAAAYAHGVTNKGSAFSSGLYKITTNSEGHVTAATAVQKSDITGLGIPGSDTTYSVMTGAGASAAGASGLVPAPASGDNEKFLRGDGTWNTVNVAGKVDINQGSNNAGKFLVVGSDGNVAPVAMSMWQGGDY